MATTALTPVSITTRFPTAGAEFAFVAADAVNGNHIANFDARDMILVLNSSADTAYDVTITSTPDRDGRTGNMVEEIPFGEYRAYYPAAEGWRNNTTRQLVITAEHADVLIAVLRLPTS